MQPLPLRLLSKPQKKRCAVATVCNRLAATFMASSFLTMAKLLSYVGVVSLPSSCLTCSGWLWLVAETDALGTVQLVALAALTGLCALFMYKYLPETKGRSLEEMLGYFQQIANTQGGPDATQASAQRSRPSCLRFNARARVLAVADLCACATQACWTARRPSLAPGSSSQTRRPSHQQSPWRHHPETRNSTTCTSWTLCKSWRGPGSGAANRDGGQDCAAARARPGRRLGLSSTTIITVLQYTVYYRSHAVPTFLLDILLVEKKTQASVHSHADLLIFLIAALSFLYTSSLRSLAPAVEPAVVL